MKIHRLIIIIAFTVCVAAMICCAGSGADAANDGENYERFVRDARLIAKLLYRECRGVRSDTEKAAVAWVVLNRVDDADYPNTVRGVIMQSNQFASISGAPVTSELYEIAEDVLRRYKWEQIGFSDVGRVIPKDYLWFAGRNGHNTFRNKFSTSNRWNFSMESPYED